MATVQPTIGCYLLKLAGNDWKLVSASWDHTIALKQDGSLWAWGSNNKSQLGNGTSGNTLILSPIRIGTDTDWEDIKTYYHHNLALKTDNTLWTWGYNNYGQLGNGTTANISQPTLFNSNSDWAATAVGGFNTYAVNNDNLLYACGKNEYGELGDGTMIDRLEPVVIECPVLATEDFSTAPQLQIYPNPAKSNIHFISSLKNNIEKISIIDLSGKFIVKDQPMKNAQFNIDFLDAGVYILQIEMEGHFYNKKLIKQ